MHNSAHKAAPRVSVLVVNFNGGGFLAASVARVLASGERPEVIVADNGSTDDSLRRLADTVGASQRLTVLRLGENRGFGAAINTAAVHASGKYILLLNPDCFVRERTVAELADYLDGHEDAGAVGPLVFDTAGVEQRGARRHEPTPARALARSFGRSAAHAGARAGYDLNSAPLPDGPTGVDALSGSCMMVPLALFNTLGAMDEGYFLHCEDLDICRRIRDAGKRVVFLPHISVVHVQGISGRNVRVERYKHSSMVRYFNKYFAADTALPVSLFLKAGVWLRFVAVIAMAHLRPAQTMTEADELARIETLLAPLREDAIVVTGATSFLAEPVIQTLRDSGDVVVGVSRQVPEQLPPSTRWISFDYFTKVSESELGTGAGLIHLAPLWVLPECVRASSKWRSIQIVAVGSSSVRTKRDSDNVAERRVAERLARAETEARVLADARGHGLVVIHPTMIYDSHARDQNIGRIVRFARRFRLLPSIQPAPGLRQPIAARDLAALCVSALRDADGDDRLFVGGAERISYAAMLTRVAEAVPARPVPVPLPLFRALLTLLSWLPLRLDLNPAMADRFCEDLVFDNSAAERRYGFAPGRFKPPGDGQNSPDNAIIGP